MTDVLFRSGEFTLHSGDQSSFLINCQALTDASLESLAAHVAPRMLPFGAVVGVPRGGLRFAEALKPHIKPDAKRVLLVDDVYTTGRSMTEHRDGLPGCIGWPVSGLVIFARGYCPAWVTPIFVMAPIVVMPSD